MRNKFTRHRIRMSHDGFLYDEPQYDIDADLGRSDPPRGKMQYPYSYDPFTIWGGPSEKCNGSVYTDRMAEWDYEKYQTLGKKVFADGRWFGEYCDPVKVEQFLREYNGTPNLKLTRIVEYCNASTGYSTWRLDYHLPKEGQNERPA